MLLQYWSFGSFIPSTIAASGLARFAVVGLAFFLTFNVPSSVVVLLEMTLICIATSTTFTSITRSSNYFTFFKDGFFLALVTTSWPIISSPIWQIVEFYSSFLFRVAASRDYATLQDDVALEANLYQDLDLDSIKGISGFLRVERHFGQVSLTSKQINRKF